MKRYSLIAMLLAIAVVSCNKIPVVEIPDEVPEEKLEEVVIGFDGSVPLDFGTKATIVTSMPTQLYWCATEGSSETQVWGSTLATVSNRTTNSGKIMTGKYKAANSTKYTYYVSNRPLTIQSGDVTITATGGTSGTDAIAGGNYTNSLTPTVTLKHIFGLIGNLTISASGYTISNTSWKVVGVGSGTGVSGTYSVRNDQWKSVSESCTERAMATNMLLIPGTYKVTVTFTATKSGVSKTVTQSGELEIIQGKKHNITASPNMLAFNWDDDWEDPGDINL